VGVVWAGFALWLAVIAGLEVRSAALGPGAVPGSLQSSSGQFVVALAGGAPGAPTGAAGPASQGGSAVIRMEPATLVLSCERVRQALLQVAPQSTPWQGRIYVVVTPGLTNNHPALIGAKYFNQGWQYQIELPLEMEAQKLVRGLVQVLLLEWANRSLPTRSAEVPLWLSEGLTQMVLYSPLVDLVVQPVTAGRQEMLVTNWQEPRRDPFLAARARLQTHAALSFSRMADIGREEVAEETWKTFQASAHVFTAHLLQLPGASLALENLMRVLPYQANWQTAFLQSFPGAFPRLLDAEKWWSVVLVQFTGHDPLNAWPQSVALEKLDDVLRPPVLVSDSRDRLPHRRRVTLQQILGQWESVSQRILLQNVLNELTAVRGRIPPELLTLVESYRQVLAGYLERRSDLNRARAWIGLPETDGAGLVGEARAALDDLDRRRAAIADGGSPSRRLPTAAGDLEEGPTGEVPGGSSAPAPVSAPPATARGPFTPGRL